MGPGRPPAHGLASHPAPGSLTTGVQTSAIRYRVVDFLKQHPPFQAMEEDDLLGLVARGRVRFHEVDEYVYRQGQPHGPHVFVIQQGTASLWDEADAARLVDVRGAGDLLGVDRLLGHPTHVHSAKAMGDLVLYALEGADLEPLLTRYASAARYLAAHFTASAHYEPPGEKRRPHETFAHDLVRGRVPLTCSPEEPLRSVLRRMLEAGAAAAAVVDGAGVLVGVLTPEAVLAGIAGGAEPSEPVAKVAAPAPAILASDATVDQCVLAMPEASAVALADGVGHKAPLLALVTPHDLEPAFGLQPVAILREVGRAQSLGALRSLNERARAFLLEQLASPSTVDWLARFASRFDRLVVVRASALAGLALDRPDLASASPCWFFFGASGRGESLTALPPQIGLIHAAGSPSRADAFPALLARVSEALQECGYVRQPALTDEQTAYRCASVEAWRDRFRSWVTDPVENRIHLVRPLFDMEAVAGHAARLRDLRDFVRAQTAATPFFIRMMAHDCLANLPPLSFFRDLVVDETGEGNEVLHLERSALRPLVDVARVFGIAAGQVLGGSTFERLEAARALKPEQESVFREAAEALRVLVYHQARAGIRHGDGGFEVPPRSLGRHERHLLKASFRAVLRLVEYAGDGRWLDA